MAQATLTIRIDDKVKAQFNEACEAMGISRGEAYREGIKLLLEQSEEKK